MMRELNLQFIEAYKRLDKLCQEVLGTDKGVTAYIDEMQSTSPGGHVPGWQEDLKTLKELRHIRNLLGHDVGTFDMAVCDGEDIRWLENFHQRVMKQTDPLAKLYKARKAKQPAKAGMSKPPVSKKSVAQPQYEPLSGKDKLRVALTLLIAGGIAWVLLKYVFGY